MSGEAAAPADPPAEKEGGCICCGAKAKADLAALKKEKEKHVFVQGGDNDISKGPAGNRSMTDFPCTIIFAVAIVCYVIVTLLGFEHGRVSKLYKPRDMTGSYCGIEEQWNNVRSLENYEYQTMTMNVSATTEPLFKQAVCAKASQDILYAAIGTGDWTQTDYDNYMCDCCNTPCAKCQASIEMEDPSVSGGKTALADLTSSRVTEMAGFSSDNVLSLFSPSGSNGDMFSTDVMNSVTKYVHKVCLKTCDVSYTSVQVNNGTTSTYAPRTYEFEPIPHSELAEAWEVLKTDSTMNTALSKFKFKALSYEDCPYEAKLCVPFPGVEFEEVALNYCTLKMAAEVVGELGSSLTSIMESAALTDFSNGATESLGEQWGSIQSSIWGIILVGVCSFVIGVLFLVLVRFFVGICVWISIVAILLMICLLSGLCYVKSIQCAGATLFDTGRQTTTQVVTYASTTVNQAVSGETVSETLDGDGNGYRGVQFLTRYGEKCQNWASQSPHAQSYYTSGNYADQGIGDHNYCRNPYLEADANKGKTIWCFTQNTELRWEECLPIGLDPPECPEGYAVTGQTARDVLLYACYTLLGFAGLWILIVLFFIRQILLAIRITKVAARFLATTPTVLLVPVVQAVFTIAFAAGWAFGAAFILSQVPDDYTPTGWWPDYNTAWEKCTYDGSGDYGYPVSEVWRDERCGGPNQECWRCQPPRYMLDVRFAYVFFIYLWVNAFTIACGQCIIAGAVAVWFFKQDYAKKPGGALRQSCWNVCRYHIGSLAFGSFIIAVVQFIRYVMKFLEKQAAARKNRVMVLVARAIQCCLWCFEKSLEYINKLAYIQVALLGTNFCTSAKKAFYLILRHMARFAAVLILGTALDNIGLFCIMSATTFVGYMIQTALYPEVSPLCPVLVFIAMGYMVGKLFMNVFHLAIDTSLQCYIAVEEMGLDNECVPAELKSMVPAHKPEPKEEEPPARNTSL